MVRVARALEELPAIRRRYAAGELSWDQVRAVTRFAAEDTDEELAQLATESTAGQLERAARRHDDVPLADLEKTHRRRYLDYWWDDRQRALHLRGMLTDEAGAVLITALDRMARTAPAEPATGRFENYEARLADALVQMASSSLGADADADRATLVVHVDAAVLEGAAGSSAVAGGPALNPETARRLGCDARVQDVLERDGRPIGIGRMSRSIPPWLARLVRQRDQGCRFTDCERTRWVQIHHLVHWAHGGRTDLDNLISLCGYHHRLVHEGGWGISGDPNGEIDWITPDGRLFAPHGMMLVWRPCGPFPDVVPPRLDNGARRADRDTS